jgi:energy-coupling factor transporter ATP-binding protein EcfA2
MAILDEVSFELRRGECLGLIGRNGAGKTTLLKMLNGLIKPDKGRIEIRGRVGALIALGAGFNPILTGPEYPLSRDALYEKLREQGIYGRRYFYPLISEFPMYRGLPSARRDHLPVASKIAEQVICLPIYPNLSLDDQNGIIDSLSN